MAASTASFDKHSEGRIREDLTEIPPGLMPVGVKAMEIKPLDSKLTIKDIVNRLASLGMEYVEISLRLFQPAKWGKTRKADNMDLLNGYPQYGEGASGLANMKSLWRHLMKFRDEFMSALPDSLYDMEDEDFRKTSILRPIYMGRHIQPPISLDFKETPLPADFMPIVDTVIDVYNMKATYTKTGKEAILDGTDAKDTALGAPTFSSGEDYHARRVATCLAMPIPDYSVTGYDYFDSLMHVGNQLFSDPVIMTASYLAFRQGPTNKRTPLWFKDGFTWSATHDSQSLYTRQRSVWAAPFYLNVVLTPLVLRMKSARKNILGMWHDPESIAKYTPRLQSQGKTAIEVDYSAYDDTIPNSLMVRIYQRLVEKNFSPWESQLMAAVTENSAAITPSWTTDPSTCALFKYKAGLMSGILPTSELGSLISISLVLWAMSRQRPSIVNEWKSGRFVILVQSDDVLFTTDQNLDLDKFSQDFSRLGITAKVKEGSTFLKRFMPVGKVHKWAKPFARNAQQTCFNEDRYDGKPPAVLRLALASRCEGIQGHPLFSEFFPKLMAIYSEHFSYVRDLDMKSWLAGDFVLPAGDLQAIEEYAKSAQGEIQLTNLLERAKYEPSSATLLAMLGSLGLSLDFLEADQVTARREYTSALFTEPTPSALNDLRTISRWAV